MFWRRPNADDYPSRTVTMIVPFALGESSDVVALVVDELILQLNATAIIENVGGARATIGTARVSAAAPDGCTLLAASIGSHVAAPVLTPTLSVTML